VKETLKSKILLSPALLFLQKPLAIALVIMLLLSATVYLYAPTIVWAEGDDASDGAGFDGRNEGIDIAASLGWISIGAGVLANVPFILYIQVKRSSVVTLGGGHEITRGLAGQHQTVLNFHMVMNIIGFIAGMAHGILLIKGLDAISLSLAISMTVLVISGIVLRFATRSTKNFAKLVHGQVTLSVLLILLVFLHVASMRGFN
jgi:hypothetical protein